MTVNVNIFEMGDLNHSKPVRRVRWVAKQNSTSSPSLAFNASTRYITVQTDTAVYINFGSSATTVTDFKVNPGDTHDFEVEPGDKLYWTT